MIGDATSTINPAPIAYLAINKKPSVYTVKVSKPFTSPSELSIANCLPMKPTIWNAKADDKNHTPIIKAINLAGARSVILDNPTGDIKSSPTDSKKYISNKYVNGTKPFSLALPPLIART